MEDRAVVDPEKLRAALVNIREDIGWARMEGNFCTGESGVPSERPSRGGPCPPTAVSRDSTAALADRT